MEPTIFPEANRRHGPPEGMDESQVRTIPSFVGAVHGGPLDGSVVSVVAWKPSPEELAELQAGAFVYLSVLGGLPPHCMETSFKEATSF